MPSSCAVRLCKSNYNKNGESISVFNFPKNEELRRKWIHNIRRENFSPTKYSKVCQLHFKESDFLTSSRAVDPNTGDVIEVPLKIKKLCPDAIPSQFSCLPTYFSSNRENIQRENPDSKKVNNLGGVNPLNSFGSQPMLVSKLTNKQTLLQRLPASRAQTLFPAFRRKIFVLNMAAQQPVLEEKCSYFHSLSKKWISGIFTLRENCFQYQGQVNNNEHNMRIPLNTICGIEKKQSSFIYACLVITIGSEKHWFSSFPNRDTVYNLLELFWRGSLLSKPYKMSSPKPKGDTPLGKELLGILHESESSLVTAANALVDQGRQLQESQVVLEDVNTDLTKAEKVLRTFNFSQSILPIKQSASPKVDEEIKSQETIQQKHYKVTFTFSKTSNEIWEKGTLIIADEIVLLDGHQNRKIFINIDSLEKIQIITPWEFSLVYSSEWISESCFIMCPQLSGLLKYVNSIPNLKNKLVFEEDIPEEIPSCSSNIPSDFKPLPLLSEVFIQERSTLLDPNSTQMQSLAEEGVISDGDMEEISSVLNNLQVLASEVSREQKQQMEQISSLITDVEKTELKMKTDIKNIKKIT